MVLHRARLQEKNLVECLSPEIRKHKIYALTKTGKELIKKIK